MRIAPLVTGLMLCSVLLFADELNVDFDNHTDFSTLKTFALREGKVNSANPELNNALVVRKIGDAIREELIAKGLKETASNPDIVVDYSITGLDFSETRGGPAAFSQGTLVIDLVRRESKMLVWRSVYRDNESNNAKLAQKLPGDVKKSFAKYPPPKQKARTEPSPSSTLVTRTSVSPRDAAMAVLEIVNSTLKDRAFVGPASHPGLEVNLNGLERSAQAILDDDGRNPNIVADKTRRLLKGIQETVEFANSIAERRNETEDSRTKARALAGKLRSAVGS